MLSNLFIKKKIKEITKTQENFYFFQQNKIGIQVVSLFS